MNEVAVLPETAGVRCAYEKVEMSRTCVCKLRCNFKPMVVYECPPISVTEVTLGSLLVHCWYNLYTIWYHRVQFGLMAGRCPLCHLCAAADFLRFLTRTPEILTPLGSVLAMSTLWY